VATAERPLSGNPAAAIAERPVAGNPAAATAERPLSGNPAAATAKRHGNRVCYHCREKGHIKINCPEIGYPKIWDPSIRKNSNQVTLLRFESFPVPFFTDLI
jgi:cytochrome c5